MVAAILQIADILEHSQIKAGAALTRGSRGPDPSASTRTTREIRANPGTSAGGRGLREGGERRKNVGSQS
jgi:hypothetical protein